MSDITISPLRRSTVAIQAELCMEVQLASDSGTMGEDARDEVEGPGETAGETGGKVESDPAGSSLTLENFKTDVILPDMEPDVVEKLTEGFLKTFVPEGEKAKVTLAELLRNQKVLIETVQHEKSKFTECNAFQDITEVMNQARQYYNKLVTIKKDMGTLHDKSVKLKKRALRLQQQKQKELLQLEQKREKEMEKERALMARPVKRSSSESKNQGGIV